MKNRINHYYLKNYQVFPQFDYITSTKNIDVTKVRSYKLRQIIESAWDSNLVQSNTKPNLNIYNKTWFVLYFKVQGKTYCLMTRFWKRDIDRLFTNMVHANVIKQTLF